MHFGTDPMPTFPVPLIVALSLDLLLSEPPIVFHPVVWMGRYLAWSGRRLPASPRNAFLGGAVSWMVGSCTCAGVGWAAMRGCRTVPAPFDAIAEGICLWPLFSLRMLFSEVASVERGLRESLEKGREHISRIVSRNASNLSDSEVRESALESLSENLSDSVIAPLFFWALFGLPGAALYRFANTADACWGYRGPWEWKGKWAAHADDALNWIPARFTAFLISGPARLSVLRTEAARTPSPNGGWPMGALALTLGVRLSKPGCYVLNPTGRSPDPADFAKGMKSCRRAAALGIVASLLLRGMLHGRL
jgi:adenosylcobinamide-phosphate synthase